MLLKICIPFLGGIFFAIILNPVLNLIENKFKKINRILSITITYFIFITFITILIIITVPNVYTSITNFIGVFPNQITNANDYLINNYNKIFNNANPEVISWINKSLLSLTDKFTSYASSIVNTAITSAISTVSMLWNILISLFISIYILHDKEHFENLFHRTCYSLFDKKNANEIIKIGYNFYSNVTNFIAGKFLDSFIIGAIACIVSIYIIKAPYPLLAGVIIGLTNMIPYFGPFIGGIPVVLITLLVDPVKGFWMAIFILILQQFDGWFLGPKILGIKLDLQPIWIIVSIIIGGGLFGPIGMFLATPVAALIKSLLKGFMTLKLKDKNINLPHSNK